MRQYYDLHVPSPDLKDKIEVTEHLGWNGLCVTTDLKGFSKKIESKETVIDIFTGVELSPGSAQELRKNSRKVLESVDFVFVKGGIDEVNRVASESWEVDILCHPEKSAEKDFMRQKNSGLDHVMVKLMAEHGIAVEFNFSEILNSYGMLRSQIIGRMRQNIILARKYDAMVILTSGADDRWGLRAPRDLIAVGKMLGMTDAEAKAAVSENPIRLIEKSKNRKDPNVIMKGLEVLDWGEQKPEKKRRYGWY